MAAVRDSDIVRLTPGETQGVVTNAGTCQAGGYYAILVKYPIDPDTGRRPAYIPLLVFRTRGLSYVTTILV